MKKTIGLTFLMMTAVAAFAHPAPAIEHFNGNHARTEVIVVKHQTRARAHRQVRKVRYERNHR